MSVTTAAVISVVKKLVWPLLDELLGPKAADPLKQQLELKLADVDLALIKAQLNTLTIELTGNKLQRSWRPHLMYLLMWIIGTYIFIVPLYNQMLLTILNAAIPSLPLKPINLENVWDGVPPQLWTLINVGFGGYVALRSGEKALGVAAAAAGGSAKHKIINTIHRAKTAVLREPAPQRQDNRAADLDVNLDAARPTPGAVPPESREVPVIYNK